MKSGNGFASVDYERSGFINCKHVGCRCQRAVSEKLVEYANASPIRGEACVKGDPEFDKRGFGDEPTERKACDPYADRRRCEAELQ